MTGHAGRDAFLRVEKIVFVAMRKPAAVPRNGTPSGASSRAAARLILWQGRRGCKSGIPVVSPLERTLLLLRRRLPLIGVLASGRRTLLLARSGALSGSRWRSDLGDCGSQRRELGSQIATSATSRGCRSIGSVCRV